MSTKNIKLKTVTFANISDGYPWGGLYNPMYSKAKND